MPEMIARVDVMVHPRVMQVTGIEEPRTGLEGKFSLQYFDLLLASPLQRQSLLNSFLLALFTTGLTTFLTVPLAHFMTRFSFRGKALLSGLLLVPMIMPPFVGAIGLGQLFARFGSVNLLLMDLGVLAPNKPIDWLGTPEELSSGTYLSKHAAVRSPIPIILLQWMEATVRVHLVTRLV